MSPGLPASEGLSTLGSMHHALNGVLTVLQTLLALPGNNPTVFKDSLPAAVDVYPLAKLLMYTIESLLDMKVTCSLQELMIMLLGDKKCTQVVAAISSA